jgi:hypothetical protein
LKAQETPDNEAQQQQEPHMAWAAHQQELSL